MHLRVTNLECSIKFYHEILGLGITVNWTSMGAAFLSAGGYHQLRSDKNQFMVSDPNGIQIVIRTE
jgi:catechol 2,3-dioxygenase-like lactoylglutathione lyase family enzyme